MDAGSVFVHSWRIVVQATAAPSTTNGSGSTGDPAASALDWLPPLLMVLGVVMLGVILTMSIRNKIARRQARASNPREQIEEFKERSQARDNAHRVMADLQDTAQQLAAQMNNRSERLTQLIAEADQRIADLDELLDAAQRTKAPAPLDEQSPPVDPLTRAVYDLADTGRDPVQIASELDEQIGKVELILALRSS